jgi:hypothetical protein
MLGDYYERVATGCFLIKPNSCDAEKDNMVFTRLEGKRIVATQELQEGTNPTVDGEMLKKLSTRNETQSCRTLHEKARTVIVTPMVVMSFNAAPPIRPADALECILPVNPPFKFVDQGKKNREGAFNPNYKLADPRIKDWVETPEVIDAFTWIMIDSYNDTPFEFSDYPLLQAARDELMGDTDEGRMWEYFDITGQPSDSITYADFHKTLTDKHVSHPGRKKVGQLLEAELRKLIRRADLGFEVIRQIDRKWTLFGICALPSPYY